jgi:hypothetical protein
MCFYNGDAWHASVYETERLTAVKPVLCDDCFGMIGPGEEYDHSYMQEHGYCQECDDEWPFETEVCSVTGGDHAVGEKDEVDQCWRCIEARKAIRAYELAEGCDHSEAEPVIGMWNQIRDSREMDVYVQVIAAALPSLVYSGYLDRCSRRDTTYRMEELADEFPDMEWADSYLQSHESDLGGES